MALTIAIPLVLTDDPVVEFERITSAMQPGERYQQPFDHKVRELPALGRIEYLEDVYPAYPLLSPDGDLDSWEFRQGALGACGHFASVGALAAVPRHLPIALEAAIYPLQTNKWGLYFVRIVNPFVPTQMVWMAIDSRFPVDASGKLSFCKPNKTGSPLAPALFLKAMATAKGGCFDEITNSRSLKDPFPGWFPYTETPVTTFEEFCVLFELGATCVFTYKQQYQDGQPVTPPGIVYGHAFSIGGYLKHYGNDGTAHQLVRVQNPWSVGSEYPSRYAEGAPFWAEHPGLSDRLAEAKATGGNYWIGWDELMPLVGGKLKVRKPI